MTRNIKLFNTVSEYETFINSENYIEPHVSYTIENDSVHYNRDYSKDYLTFKITSDGYFCFTCSNTGYTKTIQYSKNDSEWTNLTSTENGIITTAITVDGKTGTYIYGGFDSTKYMYYWENNGDKLFYFQNKNLRVGDYVYDSNNRTYPILTIDEGFIGTKIDVVSGDTVLFKGINDTYSSGNSYYNCFSGTTCQFEVEGNIMSLIYGDNFKNETTLNSGYTFNRLFNYCIDLTSAENLILPATTLAKDCYYGIFSGCTSLTTAPELPATTLADYCYNEMFGNCTSLTTVPELLATTVASNCYAGMFNGCTSLTTAPELPATTLAPSCYSSMFYNCSGLTSAPELPATTLTTRCYQYMFYGCTSLTTAPELPATTLTNYCYYQMFYYCNNLNYIKCLATNISASYSTRNWVSNVAASGTFVKAASMTGWTTGNDGIPSGWTVQDA